MEPSLPCSRPPRGRTVPGLLVPAAADVAGLVSGPPKRVSSSANVCVVKVDGAPYLCKADEVGELCVDSGATGSAYYGLLGVTRNVFQVGACDGR